MPKVYVDSDYIGNLEHANQVLLEACGVALDLIESYSHVFEYDADALPKAVKARDKLLVAIAAAKGGSDE